MFWFIVLLLVAGAGFYFYQKLITIEREIRAEQEAEKARAAAAQAAQETPMKESKPERKPEPVDPPATEISGSTVAEGMGDKPTAAETPVPDGSKSIEEEILDAVANLPGVRQTDLYESFPDVDRKKLQQTFKALADEGQLKREKKGSSFLLYPA